MQRTTFVLGLALAVSGCGTAPIVLTEVPIRPSGEQLIVRGAKRSGCKVGPHEDEGGLLIRCSDGAMHVPTFAGPPTYAVRCLEGKLGELEACRARVRKLLLAGDRTERGAP